MPSPDVTPYYDLTLFDLDAQQIYQRALEYARIALPEFDPREGTIETILLQSIAIEVAQLAATINRLPGGIIQVLLELLGIERSEGTLPTATIRFTANDAGAHSVPAGVRVFYQVAGIGESLLMTTDEDLVLSLSKKIISLERTDDVVTAVTSFRHGFSQGDEFSLSGCGDETFNGAYTVTSILDAFTFTYPSAGEDGPPSDMFDPIVQADDATTAYGIVSATGLSPTDAFNDMGAGVALQILSVVPSVSSAITESPIIGGSDVEEDSAYFARAIGTLQRLSSALVTPEHFMNYVASAPMFREVYRVAAVDVTDETRVTDPDTKKGNMLVIVAPIKATATNLLTGTDGGNAAPGTANYGLKDALGIDLRRRAHAGLTINVVDPLIVTVKVSVNITPNTGVSYSDASTAVKSAIAAYLDPDTWNWSNTIYANELINVARNATFTSSDVQLPAVARVDSVSIEPTAIAADTISAKKSGTYTDKITTSNVLPCNSHGVLRDSTAKQWLAVKPNGATDWTIREIVSISTDEITVMAPIIPGTNGHWIFLGSVSDNGAGNFVISDPAPLVASATHETNLVT